MAYHRSHTVPTQEPSVISAWHMPVAYNTILPALRGPDYICLENTSCLQNSLSSFSSTTAYWSVSSPNLCSNSSNNFDTPLPFLLLQVREHASPRPLPGPAGACVAGAPGKCVQNQMQAAGHTSPGSSQTGRPSWTQRAWRVPRSCFQMPCCARGMGLQDPSSCSTLWPTYPGASPGEGRGYVLSPHSLPRTDGNSWKGPGARFSNKHVLHEGPEKEERGGTPGT